MSAAATRTPTTNPRARRSLVACALAGAALLARLAPAFAGTVSQPITTMVSSQGHVVFPPESPPSEAESESSNGALGDSAEGLARATGDLRGSSLEPMTFVPASASIGEESILGTDDRKPVKLTTQYPSRAVVLITFGGMSCSGSLVGPDTVLTAGHCVFDQVTKKFFDPVTYKVFAGRNGSNTPFGSCGVEETLTSSAYIKNGDDRFDIGLLVLDCNIGDDVGWFGLYAASGSLRRLPVSIHGYPGDKPLTQWRSTGRVSVSQDRRLFYRNDTTAGTSGAGVHFYGSRTCDPCIVGVHTYGVYGGPPFSDNNHATRITPEIVEMIMEVAGR